MKQFPRRLLSLLTALSVAASALTLPAAASEAMGSDLDAQETAIHHTAHLNTGVFWSSTYSDLRTENFVAYVPGGAVTPMVTYGDCLTARSTLSAQAKRLEGQGYRVVAGINGDYFNTSNGLPIGLVVTDGVLRSSDAGLYAVGFRADGSAVMGRPALRVSAHLGYSVTDSGGYTTDVVRNIAGVNKARVSDGGIFLYTYDFNDRRTTGTAERGVEAVCRIVDGSLSIGSSVSLRVEEIRANTYATKMEPDQMVLSANYLSNSYFTDALANLPVGAVVTVTVESGNEAWNDVEYACGALHALLEDGQVSAGLPSGLNPRTAVGQRADGSLVFYTMDGRQSGHSVGASLAQVAERLAELGCISALCLDGGGSTAITVTAPGETAAQVINRPSDGGERGVSNQIFLVAENVPTGIFSRFHLAAENRRVLAGSRVTVTAFAVDSNFLPMDKGFGISTDAGTLTDEGGGRYSLLTPTEGGSVTVSAANEERMDSLTIQTVSTPDSIRIKNGGAVLSHLTLAPGDSLQLSAEAIFKRLPLAADDHLFTWTMTEQLGTVTPEGLVTAGAVGVGTLTVSAGGCSASIPVAISNMPLYTLENFEGDTPGITGVGMTLETVRTADQVKLGRGSGQVNYTLDAGGDAVLVFSRPYALPDERYHQLNLWVQGDGTGNLLSLATNGSGGIELLPLTTLDDTGWQLISTDLPADTDEIFGFAVTGSGVVINADGSAVVSTGSFRLDQLTASYGNIVDTQPPAVSAELTADEHGAYTLTANLFDEADGILPRSAVSVTMDGKALKFTYNADTGAISAAVPVKDLWGHRISVFARDASGNIGRASADIAASAGEPVFSDIAGHWATDYVAWLKTAGITAGYSDGTFRPDQRITRQQFASMLFNYLGLNAEDYAETELPFADADAISGYALPAVKALYSMGVIGGTSRDGALYFQPAGELTRAQAAAMIGRTQEKGFASSGLPFADADAIPSYAEEYIRTMAAQGVLSGHSDGTFRPGNGITRAQMAKILYNLL